MLIRLHSGRIITLDDHLIDLSEFFTEVCSIAQGADGAQGAQALERWLRAKHPALADTFLVGLDSLLTVGDNDTPTRVHIEVNKQRLVESHNDQIQFVAKDLFEHLDEIFGDTVHHFKFVTDEAMILVVEYLSIASLDRSETMFDNLPFQVQSTRKLKAIVSQSLHAYIDFVMTLTTDQLIELIRAAVYLRIATLEILLGVRLAIVLQTMPEEEVRKQFRIPDNYRDSTLETLKQKIDVDKWTRHIASNGSSGASALAKE